MGGLGKPHDEGRERPVRIVPYPDRREDLLDPSAPESPRGLPTPSAPVSVRGPHEPPGGVGRDRDLTVAGALQRRRPGGNRVGQDVDGAEHPVLGEPPRGHAPPLGSHVVHAHEGAARVVAEGDEDALVVDGGDDGAHVGPQLRQAGAHLPHADQVGEDAARHGGGVVTALDRGLVQDGAARPPGVGLVAGLGVPVGVVELAELVAAQMTGTPPQP